MKKTLSILAIGLSLASFAQTPTIPNANFDQWNGGEPDEWSTTNPLLQGMTNVTQATGADILGTNTIVLETILHPITSEGIPAVISTADTMTLNSNNGLEFHGMQAVGDVRPSGVTGVYKYSTSGTDSAIIGMSVKLLDFYGNNEINAGQLVLGSVNSYQRFKLIGAPVDFFRVDSIIIYIASSYDLTPPVVGSKLFIDSLEFLYTIQARVSPVYTNCLIGTLGAATITVDTLSGFAPFTFSWAHDGGTDSVATGLTEGIYTCTVTDSKNHSSDFQVTIINQAITTVTEQNICMVTVDPTSSYNIITWEKVADSLAITAVVLYKETATNVWTPLDTIHADSLSEYHDLTSNPNVTSYQYQIGLTYNCSGMAELFGDGQSTMHLQILSNGNLQWTGTGLKGNGALLASVTVYRDDNNTGNYAAISSPLPASSTTFTDIDNATYPNARYYIEGTYDRTCTPSRAVSTTRSNVKANVAATGIEAITNSTSRELVRIVDVLGREVAPTPNAVLFYIYSDGSTEKRVQIK